MFFIWAGRIGALIFFGVFFSAPAQAADWQLARHDEARDIHVYVRDTAGSSYKNFYAVTRVQASVSTVAAVLTDISAMPEWIARLKSAKLIKRNGRNEAWALCIYKLPYPFIEREALVHATLSTEKNGAITLRTEAVAGAVSGASPARVRLLNMRGVWRVSAEEGGRAKIEMWGSGTPGGYVPPLLFNYNLADEPAQTLRQLRKMILRPKYLPQK